MRQFKLMSWQCSRPVKDGERVEEGRLIAVCPDGSLGSALHASVSGVVKVEEQYLEIKASGS